MASISPVLSGAKWQMHGQNRFLAVTLAITFSAATAYGAEKSQAICTSGDLVRRVIVEVGDLSTGLPCEVVYWKDQEAPGVRGVLWNARSDAAYCDEKASGLVNKLATAGWNCDGGGNTAASINTTPAVTQPAAPSSATPAPANQASVSGTDTSAIDAAATTSAPLAAASNQTGLSDTSTTLAAATPAPSPAPAPAAATGSPDVQTAAVSPATPSAAAPVDQLEVVIQSNLSSLNQSVDGDFKATIGDFGDLNNDGIDDAVVFFNYESSTADFTQFVAAYLFNGEDYHLAATKPVGGTDLAVRKVEVETITDGAIQLKLQLNDASETGDRRAAMVLRDGQLVETE